MLQSWNMEYRGKNNEKIVKSRLAAVPVASKPHPIEQSLAVGLIEDTLPSSFNTTMRE